MHIPVTQLNTDQGFGGECHLDANMVRSALPSLPLADIDLLVIENVGNLVCPAEFRVGEDARAMVSSVTEGEDKPLKYPLMFRACELVIVNKIDLLEHLDLDLEKFAYHLDGVHPGVPRMLVERAHGGGARGGARLAREAGDAGGRAGVRPGAPAARRCSPSARRRIARSSPPRRTASRASATQMAERFAPRRAAARARRARRRRARTPATSRSSSSTR